MKQTGIIAAMAGLVIGVLGSCNPTGSEQQTKNGNENQDTIVTHKTDVNMENKEVIAHYVLFWLNDDLSEQEINDFSGFFEELKTIPGIKSLHYGRAAETHPRDVVDNSFTYNLLVYFDSMEDVDAYETHPIHLAAIEKYSKFWSKVVVHDSVLK